MFINISNFCKCHSFPNMYDMLQAKIDRLATTIDFLQKHPQNGLLSKRKCMIYSVLNSPILGLISHSDWTKFWLDTKSLS